MEKYDVVLIKTDIPTNQLPKVKEEFARLTGLSKEEADRLLARESATIRKGVDEATANTYQEKLAEIGLKVEIRQVVSALPEASTPITSSPARSGLDRTQYPFKFTGTPAGFFNIWIVNLFLTILTLGIYSAWAKVRTQQYFYANTWLDNTSFQYLANPVTILKGRLIAVAIFIVYIVLSEALPTAGAVFFLIIMLFSPWLIIRSLAFHHRYSVYRNIRFRFSAPLGEAWKVFILWPVAGFLSLGLLLPVLTQKQAQFIAINSQYGTSNFDFSGRVREYYRIYLIAFACFLVANLVGGGLAALTAGTGLMIVIPMYLVAYYYFLMLLINLFFNSTTIGPHQFECHYELKSYAILQITNALGIVFSLGLLIPWAKVRAARYRAEHTRLFVAGDLDGFVASEQDNVNAIGDEMADVFDMEINI